MRLFRRSLLCLVVGVTAFGAAGWGFRPMASWEVELDDVTMGLLETFNGDESGTGVIWLLNYRLDGPDFMIDGEARRQACAECRDPRTGQLLSRIAECTGDRFILRSSDEFLSWLPIQTGSTRFRVFHRDSPTAIMSFRLDGNWRPTNDGKRAWSAGNSDAGWCVSRVELVPDAIPSRRVIRTKWNPDDEEYAVSSDGHHLAILNGDKGRREVPRTIDLYDPDTGECRRRIAAPLGVVGHGGIGASYLRFEAPLQSLTFRWDAADGDVSLWRLDPKTGACENLFDTPLPDPPPGVTFEHRPSQHGNAWFARESGSKRNWVNLVPDPRTPDWTPIPFEIDWTSNAMRRFVPNSMMPAVPGRDAFIIAANEPPPSESVPEGIRKLLPKSWLEDETVVPAWWYDRRANRWLKVGRPRERWVGQVRRDALITLSYDWKNNATLQSWPLPPRDPKWPALGMAALCAAGTWWACARRYRRRMNRATIPPVTA